MINENQKEILDEIATGFRSFFQNFRPYVDNQSFILSLKRIGIGLGTLIAVLLKTALMLAISLPSLLITALSANSFTDFKNKLLHTSGTSNFWHIAILVYMLYMSLVNLLQIFVIPIRLISSILYLFKNKSPKNIDEDDDLAETYISQEGSIATNYFMPLWNEKTNLYSYIIELFFFKININEDLNSAILEEEKKLHELSEILNKEFTSIFVKHNMQKHLMPYNNTEQVKNNVFEMLNGVKHGFNCLLIFLVTLVHYPITVISLFFTAYTWPDVLLNIKAISYTTGYQLLVTSSLCVLYLSRLHNIITIPIKGIMSLIYHCFPNTKEKSAMVSAQQEYISKNTENLSAKNISIIDEILCDTPREMPHHKTALFNACKKQTTSSIIPSCHLVAQNHNINGI